MTTALERRIAKLERRVETLEGGRPGRKAKPIIVSAIDVCGIDPKRDSATCPDASIYRHQSGCRGEKCVTLAREYTRAYRERQRAKA